MTLSIDPVSLKKKKVKVGVDRVKVGTKQVQDGVRTVKIGTKRIENQADPAAPGLAAAPSFSVSQKDEIKHLAAAVIDRIGSTEFATVRGGADADAIKKLKALTPDQLTNVSSASALAATLATIDDARKAVDRVTAVTTSAARAPSLNPAALLPIAALGAPLPGADVASLLIQGGDGYASAIRPTGSRPVYAYGPPRVQTST